MSNDGLSVVPHPEEIEEAKKCADGWVYRIAGQFGAADAIPAEAVVGAWRVGADGRIDGEFVANPGYDSKTWPTAVPKIP